jgi:hypothetical protein
MNYDPNLNKDAANDPSFRDLISNQWEQAKAHPSLEKHAGKIAKAESFARAGKATIVRSTIKKDVKLWFLFLFPILLIGTTALGNPWVATLFAVFAIPAMAYLAPKFGLKRRPWDKGEFSTLIKKKGRWWVWVVFVGIWYSGMVEGLSLDAFSTPPGHNLQPVGWSSVWLCAVFGYDLLKRKLAGDDPKSLQNRQWVISEFAKDGIREAAWDDVSVVTEGSLITISPIPEPLKNIAPHLIDARLMYMKRERVFTGDKSKLVIGLETPVQQNLPSSTGITLGGNLGNGISIASEDLQWERGD